jgi:hypothetical protein
MPNRYSRAEIVKSGVRLYAGSVPSEVWIVKQHFEYHFEEVEQEAEILNKGGGCFAVIIARDGREIGRGSEEMSLAEAVASAERLIPGLTWDDHALQSSMAAGGIPEYLCHQSRESPWAIQLP